MMFPKKEYKELQKKLKNKFVQRQRQYDIIVGVKEWVEQSGIKCSTIHIDIICAIFGHFVPFPYVENDRFEVLDYLAKYNYKGDVKC